MRILRVAQTCYPDVTGGGAYHVHAMSRDQAALGHDVTVLTVRQEPDAPGLEGRESPHVEERDGYTVVRFDPTASPLGNDFSAGLARYLHWATAGGAEAGGNRAVELPRHGDHAVERPVSPSHFDVVHAHSHLYAATNLAALERWLGDGSLLRPFRSLLGARSSGEAAFGGDRAGRVEPPLAITNHGLYSQAVPERVFDWYLHSVGRWTLDRADVVLCYTDVDRRRLRELGVATDVAVVPNGVDAERFSPEGPAHPRIGGGEPVEDDPVDDDPVDDDPVGDDLVGDDRRPADGPAVLFVGRLVEGKRPADAIAAIEQVRESVPGATLYVCGDGPLRAELEATAANRADTGTDAGVVFLGHLEYDEMPSVYRAADVLLLPSRAEGMPRTVLEARAAGTPVVASDLEQLRSLDDDGVRTVPLGDVDELAAALVETLAEAAVASPRSKTASEPSIADGGCDRLTKQEDGDSAGADERPARSEHDWATTVRRTTAVLGDLCEGSR